MALSAIPLSLSVSCLTYHQLDDTVHFDDFFQQTGLHIIQQSAYVDAAFAMYEKTMCFNAMGTSVAGALLPCGGCYDRSADLLFIEDVPGDLVYSANAKVTATVSRNPNGDLFYFYAMAYSDGYNDTASGRSPVPAHLVYYLTNASNYMIGTNF